MSSLDDLKLIWRVDRGDMLSRVTALPDQCREGWKQGLQWDVPKSWKSSGNLLILGMGGSAIGGDLLQGFVGNLALRPIAVNRSYAIPTWVGRSTLVLACSYSGNTEETLSAARQALQRGCRLVAITSGGQLAEWASRDRFPLLRIPSGWPPRTAIGYLAFAPLGLVVRLGWAKKSAFPVERACDWVETFIESQLSLSVQVPANPAKRFSLHLKDRLPVLYGASGGWEGVTYRWRTQLEENAKTLAFHHIFPEATHNEISGWVEPRVLTKKVTALFLKDRSIHPRTRRRMEFTKQLIRREGAQALDVTVPGPSVLARMLGFIALGDFVSVYLGLLYGVDPTPVERVEALKRYMKR